MRNAVKFVGAVEEDEMAVYLQSADVYVSTSLSESGLSASTAEAMACELPVINTNTGDINLWIKDAESGFIIPHNDSNILAEKIIYILANCERFANLAKCSRRIIEVRNNYYTQMAKIEEIYYKLLNKNNN